MSNEAANRAHKPTSEQYAGVVPGDSAKTITGTLLKHVPAIVESCGATALFV
jgi:hypothetical protein